MRFLFPAVTLMILSMTACIYLPAAPAGDTGQLMLINTFEASPGLISTGESAQLTWNVTGAVTVSIDNGIGKVAPRGTWTVAPNKTTLYILTAGNTAGSISREVTVAVKQMLPPPLGGERSVILSLMKAESGSLLKSSTSYNKLTSICVGDNTANQPSRAFLSFDISAIPVSATVKEAVLDFGAYTINGNPNYGGTLHGNMGALEVYCVQYSKYDDLGRLAYESSAIKVGTLRWEGDQNAVLKLDVTVDDNGSNILQSLLADNDVRCQFRIQFFTTTNWDSVTDAICLDNTMLKVKYTVP